jgi:CRISPR system Cascade subunit CasE
VQSAVPPDWERAFCNARYLLADLGQERNPWEVRPFDPSFTKGQRLRFRLAANPTKKIDTMKKAERQSLAPEQLQDKKGRHGKRVPVQPDQLLDWLVRRAQSEGFYVIEDSTSIQPGYIYMNKTRDGTAGQRLRSVRYEGILEVTDPDKFRDTLFRGVGPGKAFGLGLLSVAAVSDRRRRSEIDATTCL